MQDGIEGVGSLARLGGAVDWPDSQAGTQVRERLAGEAGLGELATLAQWAVAVRPPDSSLASARLIVIGGPADPLVLDTAASLGVGVRVVPGDGDVAAGAAIVDEEVDAGAELLVVGVPRTGADAAAAVAVLTDSEPVKVVARGAAAADPERWMATVVEVRDMRRRCLPLRNDPDRMLAEIGSSRLALAAGVLLQAAARRTPTVLDGPVTSAAALLAYEAQPRAVRWWTAADTGTDPLQALTRDRLGQSAVLGLGTALGTGLAGLLAVPVVRAALHLGLSALPAG